MRILDRYILRNVVGIFFACLLIFSSLYIISDILSHLQDILKQKIGLDILLPYCFYFLPVIFVQAAPFSCLLGVLYTFGKLNRNNEIIAMRASGLSIVQISRTLMVFGLLASLVIFWVKDRYVPHATIESQRIRDYIDKGKKRSEEQKNQTIINLSMYGLKNRLYFVNKFNALTNTMEGITILEHDERQNIVKKIVANKGVYQDKVWRFYQCITYDFDENGQVKDEPRYSEEEIMNISETPREFMEQRQRPDNMNIAQLEDYMWKLSKSGATGVIKNLKVDLYQRYSDPLTSFIITLLAIPFSLMIRKRGAGILSLGISIIIGFFYYVFNAVSVALGYGGYLPPLLAVSLSHIVVFCLSAYMIATLK